MQRLDDPVEVRCGAPAHGDRLQHDDTQAFDDRGPEQFLWRGRLWKVRAVLAHWIEAGSRRPGEPRPVRGPRAAVVRELAPGRELWRVRAGRGGLEGDGVFELSFDGLDGSWQLVGCEDRG